MIRSSIARCGYAVGKSELSSAFQMPQKPLHHDSSRSRLCSANHGGVAKRPCSCKDMLVMTVIMRTFQYVGCTSEHP